MTLRPGQADGSFGTATLLPGHTSRSPREFRRTDIAHRATFASDAAVQAERLAVMGRSDARAATQAGLAVNGRPA